MKVSEEQLRKKFYEMVEHLKQVHTRIELDDTNRKIKRLKEQLMKNSSSFRDEMKEKEKIIKKQYEENKRKHKRQFGKYSTKHNHLMMNPVLKNIQNKYLQRVMKS